MKKKFFLVGALVVMSMSAMFVACSGQNEPTNGCTCTAKYQGETDTQSISLAEMKENGWNTCSDVTSYLRMNAIDGVSVSCNAY